mmetsp:Transcript_158145/g.288310  ORF Transcript_158145/g.288310 Transcript_158145/m.288310 type:complete len:447 (+) Transcript_158145:67-1407(+)
MSKIWLLLSYLLLQASTKRLQHRALADDYVPLKTHHGATGTQVIPLKQLAAFILAAKPASAFNPLNFGVRSLSAPAHVSRLSAPARPVLMQDAETPTKPVRAQKSYLDISSIAKGQIVEGVVEGVLDYKAFVNIGTERRAALFNSDFSDAEDIPDLTEKLKVGKKLRAKVKRVDIAEQKVVLSCRKSPSTAIADLHVGQPFEGLVTKITPFGAFIDIGAEVKALLHVSEILDNKVDDPEEEIKKDLAEGQLITGTITSADAMHDKITVSLRQAEEERIQADTMQVGQPVQGEVKGITPFGVFVDVGADKEILLHISDVLGTSKMVGDPKSKLTSIYSIGDIVAGRITATSAQTGKAPKMSCRTPLGEIQLDEEVMGTVTAIQPMGVFVDIGSEVQALMHISDILEEWTKDDRVQVLNQMFSVGDRIPARIKEVNTPRRRIAIKQDW